MAISELEKARQDALYRESVANLQSKAMPITDEELRSVDEGWAIQIDPEEWDNLDLDEPATGCSNKVNIVRVGEDPEEFVRTWDNSSLD